MKPIGRVIGFWVVFLALLCSVIIIPYVLFGDLFESSAEDAAERGGSSLFFTVFYLSALLALDVILPVPSSLNSTMLGVLLGISLGTVVSTVSMTISCAIGYFVGAKLSAIKLNRWLPASEFDRITRLSKTYGKWIVVLSRPIPVLAEATTIVAGMGEMPRRPFVLLCLFSNLGISFVYALTGAWSVSTNTFLLAMAFAFCLPLLAAGVFKIVSPSAS
jgi:uncharacterized membrane protein YdjX (TVP38/TMEM64 family)